MSYDLDIVDASGAVMQSPIRHDLRGGTYQLGGSTELSTNVTFNYGEFYRKAFGNEEGLRILDGMDAYASIPVIRKAMDKLGDDETARYWDATEGNAKRALETLLYLAALGYGGTWRMGW